MIGEEHEDVAPGTAGGAPVNRDRPRDPGVIEGEVASRGEPEDIPPDRPGVAEDAEPGARGAAEDAQPRATAGERPLSPPRGMRAGGRGFAAGALAGLIVSALAAGAGYYYLTQREGDAEQAAGRLAGLESQARQTNDGLEAEAKRENAGVASLDKRMAALEGAADASAAAGASAAAVLDKRIAGLEGAAGASAAAEASAVAGLDKRIAALEGAGEASAAGLDKRIAALEATSAENAPKIAAAAEIAQRLTTQAASLSADVNAARGEVSSLSARAAKLEAGTAPATVATDVAALSARIDKLEAALAGQKTETRVAPEKPTAEDNPAAIAIIAAAIGDRLATGAPFGPELAALRRLGVEPARLAALQAAVNGAPTDGALADSFEAAAPKVLAATSNGEQGGAVDRFLAHMRGLVRVRDLSETGGDDPRALVSQIEAESRRGDMAAALAAFGKLPEAAREAAGDWPKEAGMRQAADAELQEIRDSAIERIAGGAKP